MDRKMKNSILIAAGVCLTISLIVGGVVVAVLVKARGDRQQEIQKVAEKDAADMAEVARKRVKEDSLWAEERKMLEANQKGNTALINKDFNGAIIYFTKAINLYPKNAAAYSGRGVSYNKTEKYPEAVEDLTKAIELNSKDAGAYSARGDSYRRLGEDQKSADDHTKVIELDPENAAAYAARGIVLRKLKNYPEAIEDFTKAIELDPKNANYYADRGFVYQTIKKDLEAITDCTRAIELNPKCSWAYSTRALATKDPKKSLADLFMSNALSKQGY